MLDGTALVDGEELILRWPDGTMTAEKITVHKGTHYVLEQGGPPSGTPIPESKAYVQRSNNGVWTDVPILGLEAARNAVSRTEATS